MSTAEVEFVKYVFLDVVGFTHERSVEAQSDVVAALNAIVLDAAKELVCEELIYLPTGDGMAICIVGKSAIDSHLQLGLEILNAIDIYNQQTKDLARRFQVRVGLNQNSDNILIDINERRNIAGTGINMASRVMGLGDKAQILVSAAVQDVLSTREKYLGCFRQYSAKIKHDHTIQVYQFVRQGQPGLNVDPPSSQIQKVIPRRRLTEREAHYIGFGLKLRPLFLQYVDTGIQYAATVLLWFLSNDALGVAYQTETNPYAQQIHGEGKLSQEEAFKYYMFIDFSLVCDFADLITQQLAHLSGFFDAPYGVPAWHFPNKKATAALWEEQPGVAERLEVDRPE
jgi:class 3 adenylate cyclase